MDPFRDLTDPEPRLDVIDQNLGKLRRWNVVEIRPRRRWLLFFLQFVW